MDLDGLEPSTSRPEPTADVGITTVALPLSEPEGRWHDPGMPSEAWIEALDSALRIVESDVRATGLDGTVSLIPNDWGPERYAHAVYQGAGSGSTVGIESSEAGDPIDALVAVADDLQNSIMHLFWGTVWPVCPAHNLDAHARRHAGAAVWWCNDSDGHVVAAIGHWDGVVHPRRRRPPHHR